MKRIVILLILALVAVVPAAAQEDAPVSPLVVEKFVGLEGAWFTADNAPGLNVPVGQAVTYRLVVSNTSEDAALTNLTLTDSLYPITDCEIPAELGAGQTFECVVGPVLVEEVGQSVNVALATATTAEGETLTALDSATLTTTEATGEVVIIVGTLESIDGLTVVVDGVTYTIAEGNPILGLLEVGDVVVLIVSVAEDGTVTVILITLADEDIYIDDGDEDDEDFRDDAPCQANPPDWAPAYGWRMQCDPESLENFVLPPGQAKKLGRDNDDDGEIDTEADENPGRGNGRGNGRGGDDDDRPGNGNGGGNGNGNGNGRGNGNGGGNGNGNGGGNGNGKGNGNGRGGGRP